jgi:hypothetical protein
MSPNEQWINKNADTAYRQQMLRRTVSPMVLFWKQKLDEWKSLSPDADGWQIQYLVGSVIPLQDYVSKDGKVTAQGVWNEFCRFCEKGNLWNPCQKAPNQFREKMQAEFDAQTTIIQSTSHPLELKSVKDAKLFTGQQGRKQYHDGHFIMTVDILKNIEAVCDRLIDHQQGKVEMTVEEMHKRMADVPTTEESEELDFITDDNDMDNWPSA